MNKLTGAIVGAVIGYIGGLVVGFFCEIVSCFMGDSVDGYVIAFICAIIGAGIGLWVGHSADLEKIAEAERQKLAAEERNRQFAMQQEEQKRREAEQAFRSWCHNLDFEFETIEDAGPQSLSLRTAYEKIWGFENINDTQYKKYFTESLEKHRSRLRKNAADSLIKDRSSLRDALRTITLLKLSYKNDPKFDPAISTLNQFCSFLETTQPKYIAFGEYGNIHLPLDDPKQMDYMIANAPKMLQEVEYSIKHFPDNSSGYFEGITKYMNKSFVFNTACLMWFYAKHKPFNTNAFERVRSIFNKYAHTNWWRAAAEEMLAVIYAKNQIGGKGTVEQEKKNIMEWIEWNIDHEEECARLASGLAWMELYDLEREVLCSMVENKISMAPELQERLSFLESGSNMNIKVYDVNPTSDFVYDSSSIAWSATDMEAFFRKLGMKRQSLNYSLAVSEWKKTLPLTGNQNITMHQLYNEFQNTVCDFEGEVVCTRNTARAVDLDNVQYPDAVIFRFTSERSRGLSLLFHSEKFGRNLNITILTFFTPDANMEKDKMPKYASSIKSNLYVESFIETLLQAVDAVMKERQDIYNEVGSETPRPRRKIVE